VGVANIAFPRPIFHSGVGRGRMTWPLTSLSRKKARRGDSFEAYGGIVTAHTSASGILPGRGGAELHQTGTEFRDEVDAVMEQERRDWLEELA